MSAADRQPDGGRRAGGALPAAVPRGGAKAVLRHTAASGFAAAARAVLSIVRTPHSDKAGAPLTENNYSKSVSSALF